MHWRTYSSGLRKIGAVKVPFLELGLDVEINVWSHTKKGILISDDKSLFIYFDVTNGEILSFSIVDFILKQAKKADSSISTLQMNMARF